MPGGRGQCHGEEPGSLRVTLGTILGFVSHLGLLTDTSEAQSLPKSPSVGVNLTLTSPSACSQHKSRDAGQWPAARGAYKLSKEAVWSHTSCPTQI